MKLIISIILSSFISFSLIAEELLLTSEDLTNLKCGQEDIQELELQKDNKTINFKLPELISSPIVNSQITCLMFLRKLPLFAVRNKIKIKLDLARQADGDYVDQSGELGKYCTELGYCKRYLFDYFNTKTEVLNCQPEYSLMEKINLAVPKFKSTSYNLVPKVEIDFYPFKAFSAEVYNYLKRNKQVLATAMTIGNTNITEYANHMKEQSGALWIGLDAGLFFSMQMGHHLNSTFRKLPNLYSGLFTSGHSYETIHHWKIITGTNSTDSLLSSMNLSTLEKSIYLDALYYFNDPRITANLRGLLINAAKQQCSNQSDFTCLANITAPNNLEESGYLKAYQSGCNFINQLPEEPYDNYFMQPQTHDLEEITKDLIAEAKNEVIIISHKFKLPEVYKLLKKQNRSAVRVLLYTTQVPTFADNKDKFLFASQGRLQHKLIPDPHMKMMLIDRKKLFFGTGNFTPNGFKYARELFAVTEDPQAIKKVLEMSANIHNAFENLNIFNGIVAEQHWIISDPDISLPEEYLQVSEESWQKNYRPLKKEYYQLLKACNLEMLSLIPASDMQKCINLDSRNTTTAYLK